MGKRDKIDDAVAQTSPRNGPVWGFRWLIATDRKVQSQCLGWKINWFGPEFEKLHGVSWSGIEPLARLWLNNKLP